MWESEYVCKRDFQENVLSMPAAAPLDLFPGFQVLSSYKDPEPYSAAPDPSTLFLSHLLPC